MSEKTKNHEPDNKEQSARFIEAAKKTGADETGVLFERAFKKIVPKEKKKNNSKSTPK